MQDRELKHRLQALDNAVAELQRIAIHSSQEHTHENGNPSQYGHPDAYADPLREKIAPKAKPSKTEGEKSEKTKSQIANESLAKNKPIIEFLGFVILTFYAAFTAIQSCQSIRSADASKSAAGTAKDTLYVSEGANIVALSPSLDTKTKTVHFMVPNIGRIPSGAVNVEDHEVTLEVADPSIESNLTQGPERHWSSHQFDSITPNDSMTIQTAVHKLDWDRIVKGTQGICISGFITFNDGFTDTPQRTRMFCFRSVHIADSPTLAWRGCDATRVLTIMRQLDGYPNNETKANQYDGSALPN